MKNITQEINRLINALNAPALAFNDVAAENGFPLIPVIRNLDPSKPGSENSTVLTELYNSLRSAGNIASAYQQALAKEPRDRALINEAKLNYEQARDGLVITLERIGENTSL